jgi:hypothetical protein
VAGWAAAFQRPVAANLPGALASWLRQLVDSGSRPLRPVELNQIEADIVVVFVRATGHMAALEVVDNAELVVGAEIDAVNMEVVASLHHTHVVEDTEPEQVQMPIAPFDGH